MGNVWQAPGKHPQYGRVPEIHIHGYGKTKQCEQQYKRHRVMYRLSFGPSQLANGSGSSRQMLSIKGLSRDTNDIPAPAESSLGGVCAPLRYSVQTSS